MIEGLGKPLRSFWDRWVNRVKPVSKVDNEGIETGTTRERERFSSKIRAEAEVGRVYGQHGELKSIDPEANTGQNLDEIG